MSDKKLTPVKTPSSSKSSTPVKETPSSTSSTPVKGELASTSSTPIKVPTQTRTTPVDIPKQSKAASKKAPKEVDPAELDIKFPLPAPSEREMLLFRATMSEHAGRFDEMAETMRGFCRIFNNLSAFERNTLSCAFKNVIGSRRTSWRIVNEVLISNIDIPTYKRTQYFNDRTPTTEPPRKFNPFIVKSFKARIEMEMKYYCRTILELLIRRLLPACTSGEAKVFYYKMKGDYLRYLCEIAEGRERRDRANESLQTYKTASDRAVIELPPTHPVRLGLMLNYSVFFYEILRSPDRANRVAKQAFEDAIAELDTLSEESYKDSTVIMQLIRDNLNMWETERRQGTQINHDPPQQ